MQEHMARQRVQQTRITPTPAVGKTYPVQTLSHQTKQNLRNPRRLLTPKLAFIWRLSAAHSLKQHLLHERNSQTTLGGQRRGVQLRDSIDQTRDIARDMTQQIARSGEW